MQTEDARLAVLEKRMDYYETIVGKLETAIDRMSEAFSHFSKVLTIHEQSFKESSNADKMIIEMMNNNKSEVLSKIDLVETTAKVEAKEIGEKIVKIQENVTDLQKLKWVISGIGIATSISVVILAGFLQMKLTETQDSGNVKNVPQQVQPH